METMERCGTLKLYIWDLSALNIRLMDKILHHFVPCLFLPKCSFFNIGPTVVRKRNTLDIQNPAPPCTRPNANIECWGAGLLHIQ